MDDQQLRAEDSTQPNSLVSGMGLSSGAPAPVVGYGSSENNYVTEDLEIHEQGAVAYAPKASSRPGTSLMAFSRHKAMVVSIGVTVAVVLLTGASILFVLRKEQNSTKAKQSPVSTQDITLKDAAITTVPSELQGSARSLVVNGDVVTRGDLKFSDGNFTTLFRTQAANANQTFTLPNASGTICLDSNNCNFVTNELLQAKLGQIVNPTSTTVNGFRDAVTIQGTANQVNVNSVGGAITLSAPQDINTTSSVQFGNLTLPSSGTILANNLKQTSSGNNLSIDAGSNVLTFTAGGRSFIFPTSGGAAQTICTTGISCASGGGQAVLLAPGSAQSDNTTDVSIFINDTMGGNLLQLQSGSSDRLVVSNTGSLTSYGGSLTLGTASSITGSILFRGSGSANTITLIGPTSPSTNTLTLPNETGTICSTGSVCTGYAPSTGGTGYIQNGTTTQANANFNIQSASAASIGGVIQGAASQSADLFQLKNSLGANLLNVSAGGNQETLGFFNGPSGGIGKFSNRLGSSEAFEDTDFWIPTVISPLNMSVTADDAASNPAPNGVQTADKLVSNAANAGLYQSFLTAITGNYTFSVWLKTNSGTAPVNLRIDSTGGTPATGTAAAFTATTTWQRYSVTQNVSGSLTALKPTIILPNNATTVAAWGAQTVYGTDPQVYVYTLSAPINTQYNGVVSNGTLYAQSNEGQPTLTLQNEFGGYLLQGLNGGTSILTINNAGTLFTSSTVTGLAGVNGGTSTLNTRSLVFVGTALDQVASITTTGGVGTDILIQADNAFCFGGCGSGGDISLGAGSGATGGTGGSVSITAGPGGSTSGAAGSLALTGGSASNGAAGAVTLAGGNTTTGNGGAVSIQAGTTGGGGSNGAINIGTSVATSSISIGSASVAGTIAVGGTSQTGTITIGQSTAAQTINIGSANATTGAQSINIANGTTGANTTVNILSGVGTAGASTLNLANNTRVTTINLGNIAPAAARTITIGGGNSGVVDTINIGSGNTTLANGKTINIGNGVPAFGGSNKISIGTSGDNFAGTIGITIGSKTFADHTTLIQGGNTNTSPSAAAVRLETHDSGGIAIGTNGHTGTITLGYSTSSSTINIGNGNIGNGNTQTINIGAGSPSGTGGIVLTMGATDNAASKTLIKGGTCTSTLLTNCNYQAALKLIVGSTGEIQIGDNPVTGYAGVDNAVSIGSTVGNSRLTLRSGTHGIVIPSSLQGAVDSSTYLCRNSSFQLTTCSTTATGAAFIQGGNDFGANAILGTNGAGQTLAFETAGLTRLVIDTSGNAELTGNFNFTKEAARTIKINDSTTAATAGAQLNILGANGNGAAGGAIAIQGGTVNSGSFNGGAVSITGGAATGFTTGGALTLTGGSGFVGGALTLTGGTATFGPGAATLQGGSGSGSNVMGGSIFVNGGQGTGTGAGGSITFQTAPAGASGSSLNALVARMTVLVGGNVGIGDTSPAALFTVGSGDLFQVNSSGAIAAVAGITTSGNILPNAAGTIDLGSTSAEYNNLYLGDNNGLKLGLAQNATLAYDAATDGRVELAGTGASLFIEDRLGLGVDARTIADEGTAATATLTLEPTSSYVTITCNDANGCDITMSEAATVKDGNTVVIINASANAVNFADTAAVSELAGAYASGQYDSITMIYSTDRWIELARSNN